MNRGTQKTEFWEPSLFGTDRASVESRWALPLHFDAAKRPNKPLAPLFLSLTLFHSPAPEPWTVETHARSDKGRKRNCWRSSLWKTCAKRSTGRRGGTGRSPGDKAVGSQASDKGFGAGTAAGTARRQRVAQRASCLKHNVWHELGSRAGDRHKAELRSIADAILRRRWRRTDHGFDRDQKQTSSLRVYFLNKKNAERNADPSIDLPPDALRKRAEQLILG